MISHKVLKIFFGRQNGVKLLMEASRRPHPGLLFQSTAGLHTTLFRLNKNIINIQDEDDFKERVINNSSPVIVDFHANWCGPCKMLGPRLESLVSAKQGKLVMAKVDIDELSEIAVDHGVEAVPTVLGIKDGQIVDKFVGLKDDASLQSFIDKLTGG